MCGRKTLTKGKLEIIEALLPDDWQIADYKPSYNVAPSHLHPIMMTSNGKRIVKSARWGIVPEWSQSQNKSGMLINARNESLQEKATFRHLLDDNRCIIIADGYFEWHIENKIPYYIHHRQNDLLCMAGLYESKPDQTVSYTIITAESSGKLAQIHPRVPFILSQNDYEEWMNPDTPYDKLRQYAKPRQDMLTFYTVSKRVNDPSLNDPELLTEFHYNDGHQLQLF